MAYLSINPATGETVKSFSLADAREIEHALNVGEQAYRRHRMTTFPERAARMRRVADGLKVENERLARIITQEMGKLLREARSEIEKCERCCRFYADHAEELLREEEIRSDARRSSISFQPLGIILAIMPWNFPFWQVIRFAAPAIMAGNVAILKHAASVPQCALALEELFRNAGFDEGIFRSLFLEVAEVEKLIADPRIRAVSLTGSDRAGSAVAASAGRALKKCVLELGGSDAFIVMPSARFDDAVEVAIKARTINAGQSCIAGKRFIIADSIYEKFVGAFVEKMKGLAPGDPMQESTGLAPLATIGIREGVEQQVNETISAGAKLWCGGQRVDRPGNFYEATVLSEIPVSSPAYREEIFGPVASFFRARSPEESVRIANDNAYGLGACVWTEDGSEKEFFARELESGMVFFNALVASDPALPFGGTKRSGYGRELGREGIREFTNAKTLYFGV